MRVRVEEVATHRVIDLQVGDTLEVKIPGLVNDQHTTVKIYELRVLEIIDDERIDVTRLLDRVREAIEDGVRTGRYEIHIESGVTYIVVPAGRCPVDDPRLRATLDEAGWRFREGRVIVPMDAKVLEPKGG